MMLSVPPRHGKKTSRVTYLAGAVLLLGTLLLVQNFYQSYQSLFAGTTRSILFWEDDKADTAEADVDTAASLHQQLTHVVMPFHVSQLDKVRANLETWVRHYPPCEQIILQEESSTTRQQRIRRQRPTMVFHVSYSATDDKTDQATQARIQKECREAWHEILPLWMRRDCFDNNLDDSVEVVTLGLTKKDDQHVKGARLMFEEMLRGGVTTHTSRAEGAAKSNSSSSSTRDDAHYALYMEPDMLPIRSNWLHRVQQYVAALPHEFWILGSIFRGDLKAIDATGYLPNKYHMNGNSVYNLRAYQEFYFSKLRPYIETAHGDSVNAYDTDVYEYLHTALENYDVARHVMHYFVYTDLLQNQWHTEWSAKQLAAEHPNTVLVHGGTNTDRDSDDDNTEEALVTASAATPP